MAMNNPKTTVVEMIQVYSLSPPCNPVAFPGMFRTGFMLCSVCGFFKSNADNSGAVSNKWAVDKGENSQRRRTRVVPDSNLVLHNEDLVWLELESRLKNSLLSHQDSKLNQAKSNSLVAEYNVDSESVDELDYPDFRKATYREPSRKISCDLILEREKGRTVRF